MSLSTDASNSNQTKLNKIVCVMCFLLLLISVSVSFFHCGQINTKSYLVLVSLLRIDLCLIGLHVLETGSRAAYFVVFDGISYSCLLCSTF